MVEIVRGDIAYAAEDIIGHLVNCKGIMGGSIAKQIKIEYPEAYSSYITLTNSEISLLGQVQLFRPKESSSQISLDRNIIKEVYYARSNLVIRKH
ncbi:hypothetical protein [Paenibacillus sp. Marseille-Q7038]